jgi:hypothetical protein
MTRSPEATFARRRRYAADANLATAEPLVALGKSSVPAVARVTAPRRRAKVKILAADVQNRVADPTGRRARRRKGQSSTQSSRSGTSNPTRQASAVEGADHMA